MFAVAVIVQELAINVPSEGVGSALVQRRSVEREHLQGGLALGLLVSVLITAATLLLAVVVVRPIYGSETADLVALTVPWFVLGAILAIPMAVLRRRLDFRRLSLLALTQSAVRSVSSIVLATVFGLDASALVLGGLVGMVAMLGVGLWFAPVPLPRWRTAAVRDLLPYGGPAALASISWVGFRNGDYAIVGARLGRRAGGLLLARLPARRRVPGEGQHDHGPDGLPGAGADDRRRGDVRPAPAHGPPAHRRGLPAARRAGDPRARRRAVALRPGVEARRAAHADPRGRRRGDRRHRRCRHRAHGRRPGARDARIRRRPLRRLRRCGVRRIDSRPRRGEHRRRQRTHGLPGRRLPPAAPRPRRTDVALPLGRRVGGGRVVRRARRGRPAGRRGGPRLPGGPAHSARGCRRGDRLLHGAARLVPARLARPDDAGRPRAAHRAARAVAGRKRSPRERVAKA